MMSAAAAKLREEETEKIVADLFSAVRADLHPGDLNGGEPGPASIRICPPYISDLDWWTLEQAHRANVREAAKIKLDAEHASLLRFRKAVFDFHANTLIRKHFPSSNTLERFYLEDYIKKQLEFGLDYSDYDHSLQAFLTLGIEGIRRQRQREERARWRSLIWRVATASLWQLIAVDMALYLYGRLQNAEMVIILSGIVLMYAQLGQHVRYSFYNLQVEEFNNAARFLALRKAIGVPTSFAEQDALEKASSKFNSVLDWWSLVISSFGNGFLAIIAIWHLLTV